MHLAGAPCQCPTSPGDSLGSPQLYGQCKQLGFPPLLRQTTSHLAGWTVQTNQLSGHMSSQFFPTLGMTQAIQLSHHHAGSETSLAHPYCKSRAASLLAARAVQTNQILSCCASSPDLPCYTYRALSLSSPSRKQKLEPQDPSCHSSGNDGRRGSRTRAQGPHINPLRAVSGPWTARWMALI